MAAAVEVAGAAAASGGGGWARRYPPLLALAVAGLIALVVLPSSLNLPQSNPTTTLEYAPVPPTDEDNPPPNDSNLSSLSLAGGEAIEGEGAVGEGAGGGGDDLGPGGPPPQQLEQKVPQGLRCYGDPPRQTEDRLAPPCVSVFTGDNFGATYQGVTKDEITVLIYADGSSATSETGTNSYTNTSRGDEQNPRGPKYHDIDSEPQPDDNIVIRNARVWQKYFNSRFQFYGRRLHFWVYWSGDGSVTGRRADAEEVTSGRTMPKPFAYIDIATFEGNNTAFLDGMARRGVLFFGSGAVFAQPNAFFNKYAPRVWGFFPDAERKADQFVDYVCQMKDYPVTDSGNSPPPVDNGNGAPRRFGLLYTTDVRFPNLKIFTDYVREGTKACGIDYAGEYTYPVAGISVAAGRVPDYAAQGVARMRADGVTTVVWTGGQETYYSRAMAAANYYPEWIISGDGSIDGSFPSSFQDANVFRHAWVVSNVLREDRLDESEQTKAARDADPSVPAQDIDFPAMYRDIFQLAKAIQIAGPRLTPSQVDKGFHAIEPRRSQSPYEPSCYFEPGDYTCVKDTWLGWYDPATQSPQSTNPGCWHMKWGGQRFTPGTYPKENHLAVKDPNEPCNGYSDGALIAVGPGA